MGFVINNCLRLGLQALFDFSSRREALTPIRAVGFLGACDGARGVRRGKRENVRREDHEGVCK